MTTTNEPVKIVAFALENVKKIKAVALTPSEKGLTILGGKNCQGKTSVLDGICYALGGERYRPSSLKREGALADPIMRVELSNGIVVERKGAASSLRVSGGTTGLTGQRLLNSFIGELALDLPKFLESNAQDKARMLLGALGAKEALEKLQNEEKKLCEERHDIGVIVDQKLKYWRELPSYTDAPEEAVDITSLSKEMSEMATRNKARAYKRTAFAKAKIEAEALRRELAEKQARLEALEAIEDCTEEDEDISAIEQQIADADILNAKWRANEDKMAAADDYTDLKGQKDAKDAEIEAKRAEIMEMLNGVAWPLEGMAIDASNATPVLTYKGHAWDAMSGMEQIRVAVAACSAMRPECGFVLLDKLEQFDANELRKFAEWLAERNLQVLATRVTDKADEYTIIIEDGTIKASDDSNDVATPDEWF